MHPPFSLVHFFSICQKSDIINYEKWCCFIFVSNNTFLNVNIEEGSNELGVVTQARTQS